MHDGYRSLLMAKVGRILEGRRVIVTGASRGIGADIARAMSGAGAAVCLQRAMPTRSTA
jgi:NAD(P)-dependent dehydrogenase (short-subunit alcohol dehydrogenase family)